MRLTIKATLLMLLAGLAAAMAAVALIGWISVSQIKVHGPVYERIKTADDLTADVLPPPLYILETVLVLYQLRVAENAEDRHSLETDLARLESEFRDREAIWTKRDLSASMRDKLASVVAPEAKQIFEIVRSEFLPAIREARLDAADAALAKISAHYAMHRAGVNALVTEAVAAVKAAEASADAAEAFYTRLIYAILCGALAVMIAGVWLVVGRVVRPLTAMTAAMTRLANQELHVAIPGIGRADEIGAMAYALGIFREVAQINQRYDAEREAQQRWLRELLDKLPVGITVFDDDGRVMLRNQEMHRLHPHPNPERLIGCTLEELIHEVVTAVPKPFLNGMDPLSLARDIVQQYRTAPAGRFELDRRTGTTISARFFTAENRRLILVHTDVSDLQAAEHVAERSEQRLKDAIDALPLSFAIFSSDGVLQLYNREYVNQRPGIADKIKVGCSLEELSGWMWDSSPVAPPHFGGRDVQPPEKGDLAARARYIARQRESMTAGHEGQFEFERDGILLRVRTTCTTAGEFLRVASDITDLREKEEEVRQLAETVLAQRTAILQEVLDAVPQAIAVLDSDRHLRFANRALVKILGDSTRSQALDQIPLQTVFQAARIDPASVAPLLTLADHPQETEITSLDFSPLRVRTTPIATGDIILTISDLSDQRRAEAERLEQQQRVLQAEKSRAVTTLAGSIAHDFNNLLAVMLGFSSLASTSMKAILSSQTLASAETASLKDVASSIDKVVISAERGRNVVASLNALTKDKPVAVERIEMQALIRECEQLLRVLVPASVKIDLDFCEQPCYVAANATHVEQIVTNLCVNAVHALDGKAGQILVGVDFVDVDGHQAEELQTTEAAARRLGVHFQTSGDGAITMFVGVLAKGRYARLRVIDSGHGMTEEVAREIFKPFFTTKDSGKGTGLGLSSVLELVETYHGGIHVRTQSGTGTAFMVLFPVADDQLQENAPAPAFSAGDSTPQEADIRTETRILVVDDEPLVADLAANVLLRAGYEVEMFTDPLAALARFEVASPTFDAIVTDQTMPTMTGLEFVERIKAIRTDIPIVVCTGLTSDVMRGGALPAGVKSVLRKPYEFHELAKAIQEALAV